MTTRAQREERRRLVDAVACDQGWVISRRQLRELGVDHHAVDAEVAARRWYLPGRHTVAVRTGPPTPVARQWYAVWETGPGAVLDGASGLEAGGMTGYDHSVIDVSVPRGHSPRRVPSVRLRRLTRRIPGEVDAHGVPHVRPGIAAIRGAGWACSDRQAALLLVLPVQQGLVTPLMLAECAEAVALHRRRGLIMTLVRDIADGAHSLGELDFAALCRRWGLPSPDRQAVRRGPRGRIYLDVRWDAIGLVVEIDGIHHTERLAPVDDSLRQNAVVLAHDRVLRIPVLGLRLQPELFMAQVVQAHAATPARVG